MVGTRQRSQWVQRLAVALLCLSLALGGVGGAEATEEISPEVMDAERTLLGIDVDETGDATWTVRYQINTSTPETQTAFEELATDVENEPEEFIESFRERATELVDDAREKTDREMGIAEVEVEVEEGLQEFGVIKYEFQWTRFANASETELEIGDAISGLVVGENNHLAVHWPESYELESVTPAVADTDEEANDNRVLWEGETVFGPEEPRLVVTEATGSVFPTGILVGLVILTAIVAVGVLTVWRSANPTEPADTKSRPEPSAETESTEPSESAGAETKASTGSSESLGSETEASAESSELAETTGSTSRLETGSPEEMLSSEERVLKLIEESGGRVKQKTVTEQLGWSAARTSQVATSLREEGRIESFRIGRENVLHLPSKEE